jgi:hypothetical protein
MRRLLIFALLAPMLGSVVPSLFLLSQISTAWPGIVAPVLFFLFGLIPSLCMYGLDVFLAKKGTPNRVLWVSAAGLFFGLVMKLGPFLPESSHGGWLVATGAIWAAVGGLCSWLSNKENGGKA